MDLKQNLTYTLYLRLRQKTRAIQIKGIKSKRDNFPNPLHYWRAGKLKKLSKLSYLLRTRETSGFFTLRAKAVEGPQITMSTKVSVNKCFVIYQFSKKKQWNWTKQKTVLFNKNPYTHACARPTPGFIVDQSTSHVAFAPWQRSAHDVLSADTWYAFVVSENRKIELWHLVYNK